MLGAIAGDLAAWTYENERERFYSSLTSSRARLSALGEMAYRAALLCITPKEEPIIYKTEPEPHPLRHAGRLLQCAVFAWQENFPFDIFEAERGLFYDDKQGQYSMNIIIELITNLCHGQTKTDVLKEPFGKIFRDLKSSWDWQTAHADDGLLIYLMRAWDCFEKAWDFTSAIHNAARWENVDRHLLCCLTGTLAEAMYGCESRLLKKEYGENWYNHLEYPENLMASIRRIQDYQFENRHFFPKNSALTNVDKQIWTAYQSRHEGEIISKELKSAILRAFHTGWDDRYGFYLDNGWVYTYRSGTLLGRFRIVPTGEQFILVDFQQPEWPKDSDACFEEALYSARKFNKITI